MNMEIKINKHPIPYEKAIEFLEKRVKKIKEGNEADLLWILEHPTVYTAGIRADKKEILDKSIKIISTNRGGKITLHSPGQKIIYFVLNLNKRKKDIRNLVNVLEKSIIEFLKLFKIKGSTDEKNIGIWVDEKKIAAIGVKVTKWIAYHGCSINIDNDLDKYQKIIPCGLDNKKVTSIFNEISKVPKNIEQDLIKIFLKNLEDT
tara:strand:+ start:3428 stop:4039 length:612 start_codon:yes stop_codon:yes gene_type:complete